MANSTKRKSRSIKVKYEIEAVVTPATFQTFETLGHLDLTKLKHAAEQMIEVGYFETNCCKRMVRAKVKKGMVTKLELEPCDTGIAATPELTKLIQKAIAKLPVAKSKVLKLPLPIDEFVADPVALLIHVWGCISICIFGHCLTCCYDVGVGKPWGTCGLTLVNAPVETE